MIALDHHKTAIDRLQAPVAEGELPLPANIDLSHLDLERSGATIARDYFAPQLTPSLQQMFRSVHRWAQQCGCAQAAECLYTYRPPQEAVKNADGPLMGHSFPPHGL